jgi:hypothetical protein
MTLAGTILRMLIGLFYLKVEGREFIPKYVKTMHYICLISIIVYILFNLVTNLHEYVLQHAFRNAGEWNFTKTIFIYQFSPINLVSRNIGPFWEPGIFGIFINLSLFFRLFVLKDKLNRTLLEIISVITTFSTTNYLILFVLLTFYYAIYSKHIIKLIYLISAITLFGFITLNSDFLFAKVATQIEEAKIEKVILNEGRFVSVIRDYKDFKKTWATGTGFSIKNRFYYSPWRTHSNCGFTDIVVKLGLLGSLVYFILLSRGISVILKYYSNGSGFLLNIILLVLIFLAGISEIVYSMSLFLGIVIIGSSKQTTYSLISMSEGIPENPAS